MLRKKMEELEKSNLECKKCNLREGCSGVVFGGGNPESFIMFVGEGPGQREDETGIPFVGKAGEMLNKILEAVELSREQIYITNIVKCRPPGNRTPTYEEMEICLPWLREQYKIMRPRIMVLLVLTATHAILDKKLKRVQCRGQWFEKGDLSIMPTYHPAALLRNPSLKRAAWEDFKLISQKAKIYLENS
ncbi:MAG: uracil-DNA glycosylase [Eubacteriales bacterium]